MTKLPLACTASYQPHFLSPSECRKLYQFLDDIEVLKDRRCTTVDGQEFWLDTGRYTIADAELLDFEHLPEVWGPRQTWPDCLRPIKDRVESTLNARFNVCRCLYYENGEVGADFHYDAPAYGSTSLLASISLGQAREFAFRNKADPDDRYSLVLEEGSLLIMGEHCQDRYEHALPVDSKYKHPRFNLTFRTFGALRSLR